jgi:hypothetical protein
VVHEFQHLKLCGLMDVLLLPTRARSPERVALNHWLICQLRHTVDVPADHAWWSLINTEAMSGPGTTRGLEQGETGKRRCPVNTSSECSGRGG